MSSAGLIEVHVTFGTDAEARDIARGAVEKRLAACASVSAPVHSFYWWEDAVQSEDEIAVVFKTTEAVKDALVAFIADAHSYDVPAIVVHRATEADASYAAWVAQETSPHP